jgi:hypothetical protein
MHIFFKKITPLSLILILASCNFLAEGIKGTFSDIYGGSIIVMVDPYIEGATMCYDSNNNNFCDPDEPESSPSDSKGKTQFAINLPNNARLIQKEKGSSNGKPFLGTLKTEYDPEFNYATPITTLLANGILESDIVNQIEAAAGLTIGTLSMNDLKTNPMEAVENNDPNKLLALKASMAVTALLAADPDRTTIAGDINEKYSNINHVIGATVPDAIKLKAAVVVQEYISLNSGSVSGLDVATLVTTINNNPNKQIILTNATTAALIDTPPPSVVKTSDNSPLVIASPTIFVGGIKAGDQVQLYSDKTCTTAIGSAQTSNGDSIEISTPSNLAANNEIRIYAKIENPTGSTACSSSFARFTIDNTAPVLSLSGDVTELSPSALPYTNITITATNNFIKHDTYVVFTDSSCLFPIGFHNATGLVNNFIISTYLNHGVHNFYLRAYDIVGNQTACHNLNLSHTVDLVAPAKPTSVTRAYPALSPSNSPSLDVQVNGIESGAKALLFSGLNCSGSPIDELLEISNQVVFSFNALNEGMYSYSAKVKDPAGNLSPCSTVNLTHTIDMTPPTPPASLSRVTPAAALASSTTLIVQATGVSATDVVTLYSNYTCTIFVASATASSSNVSVTVSGLTNGSHTFYATTTDQAGNISSCSGANVTYQVDNIAPNILASISLHSPAVSPSNVATPTIRVDNVEIGSTVKIFRDAACSIQVGSKVAAVSNEYVVLTALAQGSYSLYARQTDQAGNNSPCSSVYVSYTVDTTPPAAPTVNLAAGTTSPSGNISPTLAISNLEVGSNVNIFIDNSCTTSVGTFTATSSTENYTISPLNSGGPSFTFYTRVTDLAGNMRACTNSNRTYTLSTTLSGVASIGGPLRNARVTLYGSDTPGCSVSVFANENGFYSMNNIPCQGPFLLKAENVGATLYSVATTSDIGGVVNITPITELIMNRVYPNINYGGVVHIKEYLQARNGQEASINTDIANEKANVKTALQSLLNNFSVGSIDLIKTPFTANGTGLDRLLSSITVDPIAGTNNYAIKVKKSTEPALTIPVSGAISGTLADVNIVGSIATDFDSIKSVLNNFDGCATSAVSDNAQPPAQPNVTDASLEAVENCINSYTHVDFMHDGNTRTEFALGISEEYALGDLLVQFTGFHLMDLYVEGGNEMAQVLSYVRDFDVSTNPATPLYNYVEVYKMIKVENVWKVYGNQMPVDFGASPAKISSNGILATGYDLWGNLSVGETITISMLDPHFNPVLYQNILLSGAYINGYNHINVQPATAARAACASYSIHCNQFFVLPTEIRRPNFLKILAEYDGIGPGPLISNTILFPSNKDILNSDEYANVPVPTCGAQIATPQNITITLPANHTVLGWSVGPSSSSPAWIDFDISQWTMVNPTVHPLFFEYFNGSSDVPYTDPNVTFSQMHISSFITNPSGVVHIKNVSCGYTP